MSDRKRSDAASDGGREQQPVGAVTADGEIVASGSGGDSRESLGWRVLSKAWAVGVGTGLGFGATVLSAIVGFVLLLTLNAFSIPQPSSPLVRVGIQFFFGQLLVMGGLAAGYLWATGKTISYLNIRRPTLGEGVLILLAPFAVIMVNIGVGIVGMALGIESSPHALAELENISASFYLYLIPFMLLIVGPFEELLYRGVIQTRLRQSFGPVGAIGFASVIFTLIHLPAYGLGSAAPASIAISLTALFGGSVIFGSLYEWTGNLTVVALVHGVYNSILLTLLYIVTRYEDELMELSEQAVVLIGF
ncbi:CPBP family intramembrane metalloprotease [Halonotius terrestris]|uniref:CPBP family intramembrane metalloprotease n=1 Tax=Halonotius terrestris TaxID=2487750 RepID=A0A8J8PAB4_9EURY|nr:type II CAAX endopeptidase family protein [Halonotius terrestris]TQQ83242.1 CPBP family intramembrane metalloprotease [Halonotius terrestris]